PSRRTSLLTDPFARSDDDRVQAVFSHEHKHPARRCFSNLRQEGQDMARDTLMKPAIFVCVDNGKTIEWRNQVICLFDVGQFINGVGFWPGALRLGATSGVAFT